ncbi:MAG: hypothetical protein GX040_11175 [Alcaligenaceae bacterium]|nr:hypothetical protein [Alcaligenaceae bacterium]
MNRSDHELAQFTNRLRHLADTYTPEAQISKYKQVQQASNAKLEGMRMLREQAEKEQAEAQALYDKTLAGSLGFEQGGFMGETVNTGMAVINSGFRTMGNLLTADSNRDAAVNSFTFSDEQKAIFPNKFFDQSNVLYAYVANSRVILRFWADLICCCTAFSARAGSRSRIALTIF